MAVRVSPVSLFHVVIFVVFLACSSSSEANEFHVGGKRGWGLSPSKRYKDWANKNRFQVGDSLVFKYKNGTDSVLVVDQDDYTSCNKSSPISTLENNGEYSKFDLEHWGLVYFISGKADNCEKGEKIAILVIAPRDHPHNSPAPSPSPAVDDFHPSPSPSPTAMDDFHPSPSPSPTAMDDFHPSPSPSPSAMAPGPASGSAAVGHSEGLVFCVLSVVFALFC